jgi:farnesyl-diphosphate farnesyltransferase
LEGLALGGVGKDDEARLLREYQRVIRVFRALPDAEQAVIANICKEMGEGMAAYLGRDLGSGTIDVCDYNRYCHIVAGLVGEGLTRLFFVSGIESFTKPGTAGRALLENGPGKRASDMGLFLQKTNIIRDYLEDLVDGRSWWPRSVWAKYPSSLSEFADADNASAALACLDELVVDALELAPRCLAYLDCLGHAGVLNFCAVPQVMAVMTLVELFNNQDVFKGVVKIRKPLAARILLNCRTMADVHFWFLRAVKELRAKLEARCPKDLGDDNCLRLRKALNAIDAALQQGAHTD